MKIFYQTRATAVGGRSGHTQLDDGSLGFDLASFQEKEKKGTNPEQLFAMGYAACFDSALQVVAQRMGLQVESKCSCQVGIGQKADGTFALEVDLYAEVLGVNAEQAKTLMEKTHQVCPYSNATRGNIDTRLHITVLKKEEFDL
uniref:organic hydroperoxide resistance protein n=1 Tax=Ornithobacterium rhinotracheale TaxID=28251 RepID=UPI0039A69AD6